MCCLSWLEGESGVGPVMYIKSAVSQYCKCAREGAPVAHYIHMYTYVCDN